MASVLPHKMTGAPILYTWKCKRFLFNESWLGYSVLCKIVVECKNEEEGRVLVSKYWNYPRKDPSAQIRAITSLHMKSINMP
jgi:hypothetical protein